MMVEAIFRTERYFGARSDGGDLFASMCSSTFSTWAAWVVAGFLAITPCAEAKAQASKTVNLQALVFDANAFYLNSSGNESRPSLGCRVRRSTSLYIAARAPLTVGIVS
jgi:hypothetical protein